MAININLPKLKKSDKPQKIKKGKIPTKNFINIQLVKKQTFSFKKNWPILVIIIVLALVVCKFFVFDRIFSVAKEANHVATMQNELSVANSQIAQLGDLEDEYAHYTISGMTEEELSRVDRVAAMKLIEEAFLGGNISRSWNLTGNVMTLQVSGPSLSELNDLASELELNPIVEQCVISSADKRTDEDGNVLVTFIIYLQQQAGEEID